MEDGQRRHQFSFEGKEYRVVLRDEHWYVIDGEVEVTGPTLVDAMERSDG